MKHLSSLLLFLTLAVPGQGQDKTLTVTTLPKGTERRLALVVGNRDYESLNPLRNPLNDADDMTQTLHRMGFAVTTLKNADYRSLGNGITSFIGQLSGTDVALFYFSGHGVGYNGQNYIMPVNAKVDCLERIANEGISIEKILNGFEDRHVRNSFVFLDACRNLPNYPGCYDQSRNATPLQGLSIPKNNPRGSFIAFATAEGRTADDNQQERNGLFTSELKRFLPRPNLGIRTIMDSVSAAVRKRSNQKQQPKRYEDLESEFYFLTSQSPAPATAPIAPATSPVSRPSKQTYLDLPFAEMVYVPGGTFQMREHGFTGEIHEVYVSSFWIGRYELTQQQWEAVMGSNPSGFKGCPNCPVESVSTEEVEDFLKKLNARTGGNYRLPTEAEWEYAAGGGSTNRSRFGNGRDVLDPSEANFKADRWYKYTYSVVGENREKTVPVGSFPPNSLGLYEMAGNVEELCSDPLPVGSTARVTKGGSWFQEPKYCETTSYFRSSGGIPITGFRIAASVK